MMFSCGDFVSGLTMEQYADAVQRAWKRRVAQ